MERQSEEQSTPQRRSTRRKLFIEKKGDKDGEGSSVSDLDKSRFLSPSQPFPETPKGQKAFEAYFQAQSAKGLTPGHIDRLLAYEQWKDKEKEEIFGKPDISPDASDDPEYVPEEIPSDPFMLSSGDDDEEFSGFEEESEGDVGRKRKKRKIGDVEKRKKRDAEKKKIEKRDEKSVASTSTSAVEGGEVGGRSPKDRRGKVKGKRGRDVREERSREQRDTSAGLGGYSGGYLCWVGG